MLSKEEITEIQNEMSLYENPQAACIEALRIVQRERGWISDEMLAETAKVLGVSPTTLDGVATFYNLIFRKPVGRHVIMICDSVSCYLCGYNDVLSHLKSGLGIGYGETTLDKRFTLLPICCLGDCDHAPVMRIDGNYHDDLTPAKIDEVLEKYE